MSPAAPTMSPDGARSDASGGGAVWLSAQEQRSWRALLLVYQHLFEGLDKQLRHEAAIPHAYYIIMAMLSEAPDHSLRMAELAKLTWASQSRTSHAVAALEDRGWVTRFPCPSDKRGSMAQLTPEGYRIVVATAPSHVAEVRHLIYDHLTPTQVDQLADIMESIITGGGPTVDQRAEVSD